MNTNFNGFNENIITFEADSTVSADLPVKIIANGKVGACTLSDTEFCGVAVNVRDGYAAVQLSGYVRLPYTGDAALGYQTIIPEQDGKIKIDDSGREYLVTDYDSDKIGIIL